LQDDGSPDAGRVGRHRHLLLTSGANRSHGCWLEHRLPATQRARERDTPARERGQQRVRVRVAPAAPVDSSNQPTAVSTLATQAEAPEVRHSLS